MSFENKLWESIEEINEIAVELRPAQTAGQGDAADFVHGSTGEKDYGDVKKKDLNMPAILEYLRNKKPAIYKEIGTADDIKTWDIVSGPENGTYFVNNEAGQKILKLGVSKTKGVIEMPMIAQ